jgi:hypothetical protein
MFALNWPILKGDHLRIISAKFGWDWLSSFREEDLKKLTNQKQELSMVAKVLYKDW